MSLACVLQPEDLEPAQVKDTITIDSDNDEVCTAHPFEAIS